jgi:octaprenyl-diphosphate synthase
MNIHNHMKQISRETDKYVLESLDSLIAEGKDIYEYTSHLPKLRNLLNGDIAIPKARNTLARLIFESLSSENPEKINPILTFIELSTISTYVLDDVLDNQIERQRNPATWKKYGSNKGIIAGGIQTFLSLKELKKITIPETDKIKIYELANDMWLKLWIGEGFNEEMKQETTISEYIQRCYDVCGVMYDAASQMVAITAKATPEQIQTASNIGKNYGIATMIRNDLVDLLVDFNKHSSALSKKPYEDVKKGICTHPILNALGKCTLEERATIDKILGTQSDISPLQEILKRYQSVEATLDVISDYKQKTQNEIRKLPETNAKKLLMKFSDMLENLRGYK